MSTDIREMTQDDLIKKLGEAKAELFNLRFQLATNQIDNTARIKLVKKDIARILTAMREQEIEAWREQNATGKEA